MTNRQLFEAIGDIDDEIITEAIRPKRTTALPAHWVRVACGALALILVGMIAFSGGDPTVTVYACGADDEITREGVVLSGGTINDRGELRGHPLTFYLAGEGIESVRFSCKNYLINFTDWTETREEYGNAQNFTVLYGENEEEYYYLTIDWWPDGLVRELTDNRLSTIQSLPPEMREDTIVMEITFLNGDRAVRAICVSLLDDGSFFASTGDYEITDGDAFVSRPDAPAVPRDILYGP